MPAWTATDHAMMARALQLAERGAFSTKPNPMVGCVIARKDKIVGEGFHLRAGEAHAEVHALHAAGDKARGATAYVTLEPCAHVGRPPPCADALVAAGITRVIAACRDPYASVDGEGFRKLMAAGVLAETGLMETAARELNRGFFSRIERGRPWVRVKLAASLDGRTGMASGESKWISSRAARADVQQWRARSSAILTGSGTVRADDPQLTARLPDGQPMTPPLRVVLDTRGGLAATHRVFDGAARTLAVHALDMIPGYPDSISAFAVPRDGDGLDLHAMLSQLAQREVNELQVEAGATLCGALLRDGLVDELLLYLAPVLLGDKGRPLFAGLGINLMADRLGLDVVDQRQVGTDMRLLLRPVRR
ncbi:bifunctional diaminohydroxyphosphoribosylaminopyrimidine deaminase/5-amino-6-(5-phosphoribosylamino)uracil reductase RibD [soil metagenome]